MNIDENTKVMLRLHREANNRGLNIYNPYFQESKENAIYLLAFNPDPAPLVEGIRNLRFAGAISAGFEKDPEFAALLDNLTEESKEVNRVGIVINDKGTLTGHYQGGQGLYRAIISKYGDLTKKTIVMLGAGTVARGFLLELEQNNVDSDVTVVNKTIGKAEDLRTRFKNVRAIAPVSELFAQTGDIFINATAIGSPWNKGKDIVFTRNFIKGFTFIADVTFVPIEPQLIKLANKEGIENSPGYRMFLYQAAICMKMVLGITKLDLRLYEKLMINDFKINWS